MKTRICLVMIMLLCAVFASPTDAFAQAGGGAVEPPSPAAIKKRRVDMMRGMVEKMKEFQVNLLERADKQKKILQANSVSDLAFEDVFRMLHLQKAELTIELSGLTARLDLLKAEVEKSTDEAKNNETSKTQRELLERYISNQANRLEQLKRLAKKGARTADDVKKAEGLLIECKLRLREFEAKEKKASPSLVDALFKTSLEVADRKAKLESVKGMIVSYTDSKSAFRELQDVDQLQMRQGEQIRELSIELWKLENLDSDF